MGISSSEIINTPEAKGMRLVPSSRGVDLNFSSLQFRRKSGSKPPRRVETGLLEGAADHAHRKAEASRSPEAARSLQLLQADPQATEVGVPQLPLRLPTEFAGLDDAGSTPADCQVAASADRLVVIVNSALGVFDRAGRQHFRCHLSDLFSRLVGDAAIFSPRVVYDQFRGGWAISACARSLDGQQSWFLLAYSQTGNPLGDWWLWALDARLDGGLKTGHQADSLGMAVDNSSLYLTANMFAGNGQFRYAKLRVLNKKELQMGGVLHGWDFWELRNVDGSPAFGVQPAVNLRAAGEQYLLNATSDGQGMTLWSFSQPPRQNPTLSRRFIPAVSFQLAPNAKQPLTETEIRTGDTRLGAVIFRHGLLWAAHTIAANWGDDENVAAIQWFQINPRAGCVLQQGIYGAPHYHYFSPAVMVDGEGNLTMVFNRSGETEFPSIRFTGRRSSDDPNTLQPSSLLQRGTSTETSDWGAFNGAAIAPDDPNVWIIGQYAATDNDWATWIGALKFDEIEDLLYDKNAVAA